MPQTPVTEIKRKGTKCSLHKFVFFFRKKGKLLLLRVSNLTADTNIPE
jgi:hypothetical protein